MADGKLDADMAKWAAGPCSRHLPEDCPRWCSHRLARALLAANDLTRRMADHLQQWNRLIGELGGKPLADSTNYLLVEAGKPETFVEQRFRDGYDERNRKAAAYDTAQREIAELRTLVAECDQICIAKQQLEAAESSLKLASERAERLSAALRNLEWHTDDFSGDYCSACGGWREDGHKPDCWLRAAIAGLPVEGESNG